MKKAIITGGPTNEYIDEVMKITNMSTGSLSLALANEFLKAKYDVDLVLNRGISYDAIKDYENSGNLRVFLVETTEEMMEQLKDLGEERASVDIIIHAAAVGDYKADFTFLMEDLARYIFKANEKKPFANEKEVLHLLEDGAYRIDNSSKISSYQKNLSVKLTLTPKIIGNLRKWFPNSLLVGCKLLESVEKEELYQVAQKLAAKNQMDLILANDLSELRAGKPARYVVDGEGYTGVQLNTPEEIFKHLHQSLSEKGLA
jgi:phosphopantothenate--cysteine ligase